MLRNLFIIVLLCPGSLIAEMEINNSRDKAIFKSAYSLASQFLSKRDRNYATGKQLIKFVAWMNPEHKGVKKMKIASILGDKTSPHGAASARELSNLLIERQKELANLQQRLLYVVIAKEINSSNKKAAAIYNEMKENGYDLDLRKLLSETPSLKLIKTQETIKPKSTPIKIRENKNSSALQSTHGNKLTPREIDTILDTVRFEIFEYSEGTILNAINLITHKIYWRGVQATISGKRVSYSKKEVTDNGAVFYLGPLIGPTEKDHYKLERKTLREVLEHICIKMNLVFKLKNGEIALSDDALPLFLATPEDGFHTSTIAKDLTDYDLKALKQYRGKVFEGCGIITGIGTGMDSRERYFSLDGDKVRVYFKNSRLNKKVFDLLKRKLKHWQQLEDMLLGKNERDLTTIGGKTRKKRAPNGKPTNRKEFDEEIEFLKSEKLEIDYSKIAPDFYIKFRGTCTVLGDRVNFRDPVYIIRGDEYILSWKKQRFK